MSYLPKIDRNHTNLEEAADQARKLLHTEADEFNALPHEPEGYLYRATVDNSTLHPAMVLEAFAVHRWTPKGATIWVDGSHKRPYQSGWHRRVVNLSRRDAKQFASRTPEEAIKQLRLRRTVQVSILERQLRRAKDELFLTKPYVAPAFRVKVDLIQPI